MSPKALRAHALTLTATASLSLILALSPVAYASRAMAAGSGPTAPAAASANALAVRQEPLLRVADEIIQLAGQGRRPGYSGYGDVTISVSDRMVTLYWNGALPSGLRARLKRLRAQAAVRVISAPYTWQQLQAQIRKLFEHRSELTAQGVTLTRVAPAPDATGILVGVDYRTSKAAARAGSGGAAAARRAVTMVDSGPAPVTVTDAPVAHATGSRDNDTVPFWGGSRIVRPGNEVCTNGFSIVISGKPYMLTAGHCGGINTNWETSDWYGSTEVGTEVNRDPNGDTAIISVPANQGMIYDKGYTSTVGEAVVGAWKSVPGTLVCTEGATSGVICNIQVMYTGVTQTFSSDTGGSFTAQNEVWAYNRAYTQANAGGDSGGPVIINTSTPGEVLATGTITGSDNSVACNPGNDPYVKPACYNDVYYEDINAALSHWGAVIGAA